MKPAVYIVVDIEVDGPEPGHDSMLNFAAVAYEPKQGILGEFARNLRSLPDAVGDVDTLSWWANRPEIFERIRRDPIEPAVAIAEFVDFVRSHEGDKIIVGHPLTFDGLWIDHYLRRFAAMRLFRGPFSGPELFFGAGIDLPSLAMGILGEDYRRCRREYYPPELLGPTLHTHHGLDDAHGHAELLQRLLKRRQIEREATAASPESSRVSDGS